MRPQISWFIFIGLVLVPQFGNGENDEVSNKQKAFVLQAKVESLIERILEIIQNYFDEVKSEFKCIPEDVSDKIIDVVKASIDCVDEGEKKFKNHVISKKEQRKNFLTCFSNAKKDVRRLMEGIDLSVNNCPEKVSEKTYQINMTTSYTKTFNINIKNGVDVTGKRIEINGVEIPCKKGEMDFHGGDFGDDDFDRSRGNEDYNTKRDGFKNDEIDYFNAFAEDSSDEQYHDHSIHEENPKVKERTYEEKNDEMKRKDPKEKNPVLSSYRKYDRVPSYF